VAFVDLSVDTTTDYPVLSLGINQRTTDRTVCVSQIMCSMIEDELTNALINQSRPSDNSPHADPEMYPEAHYTHYGNRGVVDLYIYHNNSVGAPKRGHVFEIKSESAVRNATGANEIIRQFNQLREFFFLGSQYEVPNRIDFELCFLPTQYNMKHILKNEAMYATTVSHDRSRENSPETSFLDSAPVDPDNIELNAQVTVRPPNPESVHPCYLFAGSRNYLNNPVGYDSEGTAKKFDSYTEYAKNRNEELYRNYYNAIKLLNK